MLYIRVTIRGVAAFSLGPRATLGPACDHLRDRLRNRARPQFNFDRLHLRLDRQQRRAPRVGNLLAREPRWGGKGGYRSQLLRKTRRNREITIPFPGLQNHRAVLRALAATDVRSGWLNSRTYLTSVV